MKTKLRKASKKTVMSAFSMRVKEISDKTSELGKFVHNNPEITVADIIIYFKKRTGLQAGMDKLLAELSFLRACYDLRDKADGLKKDVAAGIAGSKARLEEVQNTRKQMGCPRT